MATPTTEFIFLPAKASLKPEDASNQEGKAFLDLLASKKSLFGGLVWGRSVDKPGLIGIGVELNESNAGFPLSALAPFQASEPRTLLVRAKATDLVNNPVTEIAILPLREDLAGDDIERLSKASATFGSALLAAPAPVAYEGKMALSYKSSWAAGEPKNRLVMMIGWREVQNHLDSAKTVVFVDNLKPISDVVAAEMDVTHYQFKEI